MMQLTKQQSLFVEKFLSLYARTDWPAGSETGGLADPMALWREGKEATDKSIDALQKTLKAKDVPELNRIVEFGLNGLSDRNQTQLMKALFEFSNADTSKREATAKRLLEQLATYRSFIATDDVIRLCENNPFGVAVDIRGPINTAIKKIEDAIS